METKRKKAKPPPALPREPWRIGENNLSLSGPAALARSASSGVTIHRNLLIFLVVCMLAQLAGCVSDEVSDREILASYQQALADQGPQRRVDTEGQDLQQPLGLLSPTPEIAPPELEVTTDPNTGKKVYKLAIEQAISRTLANSTEIRVVSFEPAIAKEDITRAAAEFDVATFGRLSYEKDDSPINSIFQPGQSNTRLAEAGFKQKITTGSEWSLSYALTRGWDDLTGRTLPTRYEPILAFQLKQPLLRSAWQEVNLAGVNIARLNHEIALVGFRQRAEDISTQVVAAYWLLLQARRDSNIQQRLLDRTLETLEKVKGREEIDATAVQVKQAEASVKAREAVLLQTKKRVFDVQDALIRLMADPQMNLLGDSEVVPVTAPYTVAKELEPLETLGLAMKNNPAVQQSRIAIAIADLNIDVAENEKMPRLDLVASTRLQGLARGEGEAQDKLNTGDYASYALGFSFEYPLGNRQREAEFARRKLERSRTVSALQNVADQVAVAVKETIRKVETNHAEIQVQRQAAEAAGIHLQALEDTEAIRERLTPEFLLVKLQAQESLAESQRAEIRAIVDFNISLAQLAQATGTVLELHHVRTALPAVSDDDEAGQTNESASSESDSPDEK